MLSEILEATGWQKHTVRGFVSILGSQGGYTIESSQNNAGERTYKSPSRRLPVPPKHAVSGPAEGGVPAFMVLAKCSKREYFEMV